MNIKTQTSQIIEINAESVLVNTLTDRFYDVESIDISFIEGNNKVIITLKSNVFNALKRAIEDIEF